MSKKNGYGKEVAQEQFLELLQKWMEEAEALGKRSMGNEIVRAACHSLFKAFEAMFDSVQEDETPVVFVAVQHPLRDYSTTDDAYGDVPF